jgi:hypothetical protein
MKIKQTNRTYSNYLKSKHIYFDERLIDANLDGNFMSDIINEWAGVVNTTRQKMKNVITKDEREHGGVLLTSFRREDFLTDKDRIEYLMDEIGVYWVPPAKQGQPYLWYRREPDYHHSQGNEWYDYFGDDSITQSGGLVVVLLSDEGVKYLNKCAMKVGFRPSPTRKKSGVEILPPNEEDVKNLIEQFRTYLYEDETDWSIGTKLIQQFWDPKANLQIIQSLWEGSL